MVPFFLVVIYIGKRCFPAWKTIFSSAENGVFSQGKHFRIAIRCPLQLRSFCHLPPICHHLGMPIYRVFQKVGGRVADETKKYSRARVFSFNIHVRLVISFLGA